MRFWLEVINCKPWDGNNSVHEQFKVLKSYDADHCDKYGYRPDRDVVRADAKWVLVEQIKTGSEPFEK